MNEAGKFVQTRTVVEEDLDELNHVNNLQYLRWTLKAASAHSLHVGWPSQRYRDLGSGWIVRSHQITYKVPAILDDQIQIRTWVAGFDKVSSVRKYEIIRESDGTLCATAETRWVFVDFATLKLREIPQDIKLAFGF
jgi:acyl-CoA thioester hydrolase